MSSRFLIAGTVIQSFRDNGYNNSAYALAELIDNSLQAGATRVEVGFIEGKLEPKKNYTVSEISVWDNGKGMDSETLRKALQFGGGTHREDSEGMGKFGMGLPNSSISQCKRVDVWSWKGGQPPYHTYLDVDEMKAGSLEDVPEPKEAEIPQQYKKSFFTEVPTSGTLIVWSKLDRLSWKTGRSIYRHCEHLVGRMYRNFIADDEIKIDSIIYRKSGEDQLNAYDRQSFKANDPMYLLKKTSLPDLPGEYKSEAFFEKVDEEEVPVEYEDVDGTLKKANVKIVSSIVKKAIADAILKSPEVKVKLGATDWGKHCSKNVGVSIVRANRELVMRDSFFTSALRESKGRFIGLEVSFPPALDNVFGVTNNKQDAVKLLPYNIAELSSQEGFDSEQEYLRDLDENGDSMRQVLNVVTVIKKHVAALTKKLDSINVEAKGTLAGLLNVGGAAAKATQGAQHRAKTGHEVDGDLTEKLDKKDVIEHLTKKGGMSQEDAEEKAQELLLTGNRFYIEDVALDSDAFFDVSTSKGLTLVQFNTSHVFHKKLLSQLDVEQLEILQTAIAGFARVMNETSSENRKAYLDRVRREWGLVINDFLSDFENDEDEDF